ncbi:MAG TPA: endonuclease/exonuclease/phosphatase family protein [Bacteroidales bacterium]|nr:endonuclease/exonuclease/phosphatase family protein [Bacteroidales bacterium]
MPKFLKVFLWILGIPVAAFALLVLYATLSDYKPGEKELISRNEKVKPALSDSSVISLMIWNLGYAGLGSDMDFFYDGGKQVRTSKEKTKSNFAGIDSFIKNQDSVEIFMLQEVDIKSHRSYSLNEVARLSQDMGDYEPFFSTNYNVFFVPVPFNNPMGSVNSGILTLSKYTPAQVERYSFPGRYAWPKRLFMLDRCFMVMHVPVGNGKELLVINTHNEAYDDGSIRDAQMAYLKDYLVSEYNKGNYIVVGGDWNQCPPEFKPQFQNEVFDSVNNKGIKPDYLPSEWQWIYESSVPTNRRVDITYTRGKTMTTVIDFFLLSPNLKALSVSAKDLGFKNSDHQPVFLKMALQ